MTFAANLSSLATTLNSSGQVTANSIANNTITGTQLANNTITPVQLSTQSQYTGFKNRIINGAMVIDQRNAGASVTPTNGQYLTDRWFASLTQSSKYNAQQNAGAVTPPAGFINYLGFTSSSAYSVAAGDIFATGQAIEGLNISDLAWGTASAKTVTISFQAYSSLTGTFGATIRNGSVNRSYPFSYSIPVANTWTSISVTIPGDTSGTWATNGTVGITITWSIGCGSTYSGTAGAWANGNIWQPTGSVSVVGTSGATFYITGVQLEVGSVATSFDVRDYGRELILCQRYCQLYGAGMANQASFVAGQVSTVGFMFPVKMRATPTESGVSNFLSGAINATAVNYLDSQRIQIDFGYSALNTLGIGGRSAILSAEL
jgi:hypothetical protein